MGAVFVLLLYFLILMRLIQNAQTAADLPGSLIIMGIVAVLAFQIAVNVGMVIGFMPVTGIPLPLMSYGGSSVLFTFLALGVVMNVRMRRFVNWKREPVERDRKQDCTATPSWGSPGFPDHKSKVCKYIQHRQRCWPDGRYWMKPFQ